ncbi:uncharacterized protein LOC124287696 isoform X1 [Haliotis rubra]|nr:uncharacterized protein LOC124287696 isoform X1 [Haliotis rubra]XP_046580191.1 uncharacterized protein LOC124287696 isoform X1 [Haliotis rubra]XP_046580199.1 uncharacterized protein LOC124287696 isoform X1 [Haliotis rubra]
MDPNVTFKRTGIHVFATLLTVFLAVVADTTNFTCPTKDFTHMTLHNDTVYIAGAKCVCRENLREQIKNCAEIPSEFTGLVVLEVATVTHLLMCYTSGGCETRLLNGNDLYSRKNLQFDPPIVGATNTIVVPSSFSESTTDTVLYTTTKVAPGNNSTSTLSAWNVTFQTNQSKSQRTYTIDLVENVKQKYRENYNPVGGFSVNGAAYFFANQIQNSSSNSTVSKLIFVCRNGTYRDIVVGYNNTYDQVSDVVLLSESRNQQIFNSAYKTKDGSLILAVFEDRTKNRLVLTYFSLVDIQNLLSSAPIMDGDNYLINDTSSCEVNKTGLCQGCPYFIGKSSFILNSLTNLLDGLPNPIYKIHKITGAPINGGHHSLILVAPTNGPVQMLYIDTSKKKGRFLGGTYIRTLSIDGSTVRQMKIHDDNVIILYKTYTEKVPLYSGQCSVNGVISLCFNGTNPFCGWCRKTRSCTTFRNCSDLDWIPVGGSYGNISVENLSPEKGPMSGGTLLSLNGSNHDLLINRSFSISIGKKHCTNVTITSHDVMTCITPRSHVPGLQNVTWTSGDGTITSIGTFLYVEDPTVGGIFPNRSFDSGGRDLEVSGTNLDAIQEPRMLIVGESVSEGCRHKNATLIVCSSPKVPKELRDKLEMNNTLDAQADMIQVDVEFIMDGVDPSLLRQTLEVVRDPKFFNFSEDGMTKELVEGERTVIVIKGERINVSATATDLHVTVGTVACDVLSKKVYRTEFHFLAPVNRPATISQDSAEPEVQVRLGNIRRRVGYLRYIPPSKLHLHLYIAVGILGLVVLGLVILGVLLRRRSRLAVEKLQDDMEQMELRIQTEFRQAFAELQTDMTDITGELVETGLPYNKFNVYAFQILFPTDDVTEMTSHKLAGYPEIDCVDVTTLDTAMLELEGLFLNKFFVITIINTLEKQRKLSLSDKSTFAGCLAACLLQNMDFFSQLTKLLLEQYIPDAIARKKHKSLFEGASPSPRP